LRHVVAVSVRVGTFAKSVRVSTVQELERLVRNKAKLGEATAGMGLPLQRGWPSAEQQLLLSVQT
jgi:hypothetical protein